MKKCQVLFGAAIVTAVLSITLFAQAREESSLRDKRKAFEQVWKTINKKYFDPTFGGVNWGAVRSRYYPLAVAAASDAEFHSVLQKMIGELSTSHLEILSPEVLRTATEVPMTTGLGLKEIEGQVVVWRILKMSAAAESVIRPGFVIKTIDGAPVGNLEEANSKLRGKVNTKVAIIYLNEKDELTEASLERRLLSPFDIDKQEFEFGASLFAFCETKRLHDNIGYIYFTSFISPLQKKVRAAIESMNDTPGIIIDLRGNGGGDDSVGLAMANALFEKKTLLMITRTRGGDDHYYTAKPNKISYKGKVVILLDQKSASASEQFGAGMQESGRAIVIGKTTQGADLDADGRMLSTGALFLFPYGQPRTPKGIVIEGRGVIPDIEVNLTRKGLLEGKDEQLEAAIEFLRSK